MTSLPETGVPQRQRSASHGPAVLVIGAGIGGLTTALELHRAGLPCRVVESVSRFAALAAYDDRRREATAAVVLANRQNPPDAILREVYERTGDRPFERLEDYVTVDELARIAENYKRVAGFTLRELQKEQ